MRGVVEKAVTDDTHHSENREHLTALPRPQRLLVAGQDDLSSLQPVLVDPGLGPGVVVVGVTGDGGGDGDVGGPVWGGGVGQGPPLPAGHHSAHSRQGGDDGRGHAHRDEDRPEAGPRPRGWVPGADEVLVDALGQSVGLPAASGLALERVLAWRIVE